MIHRTCFKIIIGLIVIVISSISHNLLAQQNTNSTISGTVKDKNGNTIEYATIYIKESMSGTQSDTKGEYILSTYAGTHTLCVQMMGYNTHEQVVNINPNQKETINVTLSEARYTLEEVVVSAKSTVQRINESPYNAVAIDAKLEHNTTANISGLLNKISGVKIREAGGMGSDINVMMDGFNGKHIKVFIDGVPQESAGQSIGINNIPVNYAERIEVYKGVIPVEFATDAIGGIINIVTKNDYRKKKNLDASYSYGSFNTHKSYINFRNTLDNGFTYELTTFQNYSDNNYKIDTPVKEFLPNGGSSTNKSEIERVKRFHDKYHNESISGKIGIVNKSWADKLLFGINYNQYYKEIQTGVRQDIVFGGKYKKSYSIAPSLEFKKRNIGVKGLDATITINYNNSSTQNVDTTKYEYNWRGEKRLMNSGMAGEQSYNHLKSIHSNWSSTLSLKYQIKEMHRIALNNIYTTYKRSNKSLLTPDSDYDLIPKKTIKNISGISYQIMPNEKWNASIFGKYYNQYVSGPVATSSNLDDFVLSSKSSTTTGYGAAATYFILKNIQTKLSYERAYRLPTNNEMFGDEDLESGDITLSPESSNNINLNISVDKSYDKHYLYIEGGLIYRNIRNYIQRNITGLSGGRYGATYINHGKVLTKGYSITARYNFGNILSIGGNFSEINVRDNIPTQITGAPSNTYKSRMPNTPYIFANADITFYQHNLGAEGNTLTVSYDNFFVKQFPLYSEALGNSGKSYVPTQLSHNVSLSYSIINAKYNISIECQNLTDAKLYDNFSLQKAGRALYGKIRISL